MIGSGGTKPSVGTMPSTVAVASASSSVGLNNTYCSTTRALLAVDEPQLLGRRRHAEVERVADPTVAVVVLGASHEQAAAGGGDLDAMICSSCSWLLPTSMTFTE